MKVRYVNSNNQRLTLDSIYEVIGIEADCYRIVNDVSSPCLYEPEQFEMVDALEPEIWVSEIGDDGERYAYPKEWNSVGFFEDFHDNVQPVIEQFWRECYRFYGISCSV